MKRGTTPILKVELEVNMDDVSTIEFLFKQECAESAATVILKEYPSETEDVEYDEDRKLFLIKFSEEETRSFLPDSYFYMDTRVTFTGGFVPETNIVRLKMNRTLFEEEENE